MNYNSVAYKIDLNSVYSNQFPKLEKSTLLPDQNLLFLDKVSDYYVYSSQDVHTLYLFSEMINIKSNLDFKKKSFFGKNRLTISLTTDCNLNCKYCYVNPKLKKEKKVLTLEVLKPFLNFFYEINRFSEEIKINFYSSGETLLYFNQFKEIVEYIFSLFSNQKKQISFKMVTNGTLLNREIISFLQKYNFSVTLSYDGPGFNELRSSDFLEKKVLDALNLLMDYNLLLNINVVLRKKHIENFESVYSFFSRFPLVEFIKLNLTEFSSLNSSEVYTYNEYLAFLKKYRLRELKNGNLNYLRTLLTPTVCATGFSIANDGNIYSCMLPFSHSFQFSKNEVKKYFISKLNNVNDWSISSFKSNYVQYKTECSTCFYRYLCMPCEPFLKWLGGFFCYKRDVLKYLLIYLISELLENRKTN